MPYTFLPSVNLSISLGETGTGNLLHVYSKVCALTFPYLAEAGFASFLLVSK